ncbi:MAG: helix-turn-helix transcriptional regulator [Synechococcales cyanobacterium RM1_1_8]|nr:helix-turn-helix transcriptional regulator [Synechococcales cyanobacterium RM1_1_8]
MANRKPGPPQSSVYEFTPSSTAAEDGQLRVQVITRFLTPEYLEALAEIIRDDSALPDLVVAQLYEHLEKIFYHKVSLATPKTDAALSDPLDASLSSAVRPLDEAGVRAYLRSSLLSFFEQHDFKEKFAKAIGTNVLNWVLDELESREGDLEALNEAAISRSVQAYINMGDSTELKDKVNLFSQIYSQDITQKIIDSLRLPSCSVEDLERLLGLRQPPSSDPRPALELSPIVPVPTAIPIASSIKAQLRGDLWQKGVDNVAVFRYQSKNNTGNYIEHNITNAGDIALLPWEAADQIINKFGFDTVKLQLILAARAMDEAEPWKNSFTLKATDIIHLLGWDRNHATSLPEKRNQVASAAYALSCLLVKSVWLEGRGTRKIDASTPIGRMWDILIDPHGQIDLATGKIEKPDEVYITVVPGLWTKHFLNRAGSRAKEALNQFGYLARDILRIDPYHNELALRLAIQLTLDSRVRAQNDNPYIYRVAGLLEEVLAKPAIHHARIDKYGARDLRKRWDKALILLQSLGWEIEFDPETYPEWIRPDSKAEKPQNWRKVKLIERLLNAKLTIKPPNPIPALLSQIKGRSSPQKQISAAPIPEQLTGDSIKAGRKQRGWTRKELAGFLGLSADYIGKLERGDRPLTDEIEGRLKTLLALKT